VVNIHVMVSLVVALILPGSDLGLEGFAIADAAAPPAAHRSRHATPLPRHSLISRQPSVARSITILVPPYELPIPEWLQLKPS
jgi:hypothetical protein